MMLMGIVLALLAELNEVISPTELIDICLGIYIGKEFLRRICHVRCFFLPAIYA